MHENKNKMYITIKKLAGATFLFPVNYPYFALQNYAAKNSYARKYPESD